jgi:hypothetical protein
MGRPEKMPHKGTRIAGDRWRIAGMTSFAFLPEKAVTEALERVLGYLLCVFHGKAATDSR